MAHKMHEESKEDAIIAAFKVFDQSGDGRIDPKEMRKILVNLGEDVTIEDVETVLKAADQDGDGFIDYKEFTDVILGIRREQFGKGNKEREASAKSLSLSGSGSGALRGSRARGGGWPRRGGARRSKRRRKLLCADRFRAAPSRRSTPHAHSTRGPRAAAASPHPSGQRPWQPLLEYAAHPALSRARRDDPADLGRRRVGLKRCLVDRGTVRRLSVDRRYIVVNGSGLAHQTAGFASAAASRQLVPPCAAAARFRHVHTFRCA